MKKLKIFDIEYLENAEFNEEDLAYLFDTNSFNMSLIVAMFNLYETKEKSSNYYYLFSNCKITYFQRNSKCVYSSKDILFSVKRKKKTI